MAMTIKELLASTNTVNASSKITYKKGGKKKESSFSPFGAKNTFKSKKFGTIYAYNKVVKAKPKYGIIEIVMMIKAVSEKVQSKREGTHNMAAHKVMVAIKGVESEIVSADELVARVKAAVPAYADESRYTKEDIILSAIDPDKKPFHNKTVLEDKKGQYAIINDKIPDDAIIRVWCSCSSYYYSFMWYNIENDCCINLGRGSSMFRYKHKTERGKAMFDAGTPMRNQQKAPGMCKHLLLLLAMLTNRGTIASMGGTGGTRTLETQYRANISKFKKSNRLNSAQYSNLMKEFNRDRTRQNKERNNLSGTGSRISFGQIASSMRGDNNTNE